MHYRSASLDTRLRGYDGGCAEGVSAIGHRAPSAFSLRWYPLLISPLRGRGWVASRRGGGSDERMPYPRKVSSKLRWALDAVGSVWPW